MMQKLLLCSSADKILAKAAFLFEKPAAECNIVCITTAANPYPADKKGWLHDEMQAFTDFGFNLTVYDLAEQSESRVADALQDADIIYVTGGNTYYLLQEMQACRFEHIIKDCVERGVWYIGSSAGAIVTGPSISFIGDLDNATAADLTHDTGLGLVDFHVMPHIDNPKYAEKIQKLVAAAQNSIGSLIGLKDDQALVIQDNYIKLI